MTIEYGLYNKLKNDAGINALVSGRVYPLRLPQQPTLPAITYQRISTVRLQQLGGVTNNARVRFQIDSFAETFNEIKDIAAAIRAALDGFKGTLSSDTVYRIISLSENDLYENEADIYRNSQDYEVWHLE
ncbi:DUF3168 domain-containing protein [Candidatus Parcubacteria bacterium]|nr:MAG: DUF3168 domain-containing protein [Candidatus Parcubacteria bacterium]